METELSTTWRPEQVCERLGIGTSTYYNRLKYLEIEPSRDDEGPYLTQDQMKEMEDLNEHIKKTGKTRGFRDGGELAISENSDLASASALEIPEVEENFAQMDDETLNQLVEEAGELKTQQIAMPYLVKLHLANNMTEEDLSDEQKSKLQAVREAANPKQNAAAIANKLLERYRSGKK
jgi:hypothetical protein